MLNSTREKNHIEYITTRTSLKPLRVLAFLYMYTFVNLGRVQTGLFVDVALRCEGMRRGVSNRANHRGNEGPALRTRRAFPQTLFRANWTRLHATVTSAVRFVMIYNVLCLEKEHFDI